VLTNISRHWDSEAGPRVRNSDMAEFDGIDVGDIYGDGATLAGLSLLTWGSGAIGKRDHLRETGWMMTKGLILDGLMVNAIKVGVRRTRPDGSDSRSFPSGHSSSAFTISTILSRRYGWKMAIPAYTLATTTAIARMEDNRHYLSDVVAGAALGVAIGELITGGESAHSRLQVTTTTSTVGLRLRF
jgi:membrane-associated phospholipid phosphatase